MDHPTHPQTERSSAKPKHAATSSRVRGSRLEQAVRGAARMAVKRGEHLVKVQTTIRLGSPKRRPDAELAAGSALLLDAGVVMLSRWANRHPESYLSAAFMELKKSIQHDGGNQVPVLVRRLNRTAGLSGAQYELVYGHRRLRACQELGLPVRAVVEELSDSELIARMHAENRDRESLSAYESGLFYKRLLDSKMFASQRKMAEALGIDHADASRKIWLASLPTELLQVFGSPLEISCDDTKRMQPAWRRNSDAMQRRAQTIYESEGPLPVKKAVGLLIAAATGGPAVGGSDTSALPAERPVMRELVEIQSCDVDGVTFRVNTQLPDATREELKLKLAALVTQLQLPDATISTA